jgi:hypothetical protein
MRRKSLRQLNYEARRREFRAEPERKKFRKVNRKRRNRHHLVPKSRGGSASKRNLLYISVTTHCEWHKVFKNLTLDEVIELLMRVRRAKATETV